MLFLHICLSSNPCHLVIHFILSIFFEMSHKRETLQELVLLKENSNRNYVSFHHLEQAPKQLRKFVYLTTVVSTQKHNIQ